MTTRFVPALRRRAASLAAPALRVSCLSAVLLWGAPAWAQVTQSGTPAAVDPTLSRDEDWRDGRRPSGDWNATIGFGLRLAPEYEGADHMRLSPAPFAAVSWKDLVSLDLAHGLAVYPVRSGNLRLGFSVGYGPGRDESRSDRLTGLGDIDAAVRTHALAVYRIGPIRLGVDASKDIGGSDGVQVQSSITVRVPVSSRVSLSAGTNLAWADGRYTSAFFGITPAQSALSGLSPYHAGAGFKRVDFDLGASWAISSRLVARTSVGVGRFLGDAADSPVVERPVQPFLGFSLARRF